MAEVSGSLIFKLSEDVFSKLNEDTSNLDWNDVQNILMSSCIELEGINTEDLEHASFYHEGLEKRKGYILIYPFDEEYMELMKLIVNKGKEIEVYGLISHEYGLTEYYALNKEGKKFIGAYDDEGEENIDKKELISSLLKIVPDEVKQVYNDIF